MRTFYRNFVMAGVLSLGLAACGDDVTIPVAPPPPPAPETPNITTFSVSPTSATIAPGTFLQASSTLITKPGVTGTVTWESSNPAVATVDASGLITAVTDGATVVTATATAGGQTATASVGVTVRPIQPAQVSIKSITTGLTNLPVNVSNVFGQIEITLNFDPGEQIVDSVSVFIGNKRAAKQSFATSPSAGEIVLSVNTANYMKDSGTGVATVDYLNGATTISAAVYPRGSSATATNSVSIVLNNSDGWAADMSAPTVNANAAVTHPTAPGQTFWGGPTAGGLTTVTVYPVTYTAGRSVTSVFFTVGGCAVFNDMTVPFRADFGYTAAGATAPNCGGAAGYEWAAGARDNVMVTAAIDNTNNAYPTTPLIPNTVVLGSTPDSLRFDWRSPAVTTPQLGRTLPAVPGWVNASFSFINFPSADAGVGLNAARDRMTTYAGCGAAAGTAMPNGTGDDIPECAANTQGGTAAGQIGAPVSFPTAVPAGGYVPGAAPYRVTGTETDRLANVGTSAPSVTFGVDKTNPTIRWGTVDAGLPLVAAAPADTVYWVKPVPGTDLWRAEYLDGPVVPSGFYNMGQPDGLVPNRAAQQHALSTAGHVDNMGLCLVGAGPIGSAFVTAPMCTMPFITVGGPLRVDGWQAGQSVDVDNPVLVGLPEEGYFGYRTTVTDQAGNPSDTLFRKALVNAVSPFATGIGIPGTLTPPAFNFQPTFADSAEVAAHTLQMRYPNMALLTGNGETDSIRWPRTNVGTIFNDEITSPYVDFITPAPMGGPHMRHLEVVTAVAFPVPPAPVPTNVDPAPAATKPVTVAAHSWNFGSFRAGGPAPGRSLDIAIPALLVQDGVNFINFNFGADGVAGGVGVNADNTNNSLTHWRVIPSLATTNFFGSTVPLRAQAASPLNTPNAPFVRVDFYRYVPDVAGPDDDFWSYLGSDATAFGTDQGTYRSWLWDLPTASFAAAWNGAAQGAVITGDIIAVIGITAAGDAVVAGLVMP